SAPSIHSVLVCNSLCNSPPTPATTAVADSHSAQWTIILIFNHANSHHFNFNPTNSHHFNFNPTNFNHSNFNPTYSTAPSNFNRSFPHLLGPSLRRKLSPMFAL